MSEEKNTSLITRDWLAIERTGVTILKLEIFTELKSFGIILVIVSPVILLIGVIRLIYVRKLIRKHYNA